MGGRACAGEIGGRTRVRRRSGVKGHSRDDRSSPFNNIFNDLFQRRKDCTRGTLAHGILETRLCRVALLSNHTPPLLALIICLTVDVGMFLALLLTTRLAFFLLIFLGELPSRGLLLPRTPRTRIFARREVGPATVAVVLRVRRRFLRLEVGPAASAVTLLRSLMSDTAMVLRARRRFLRLEVGPAASAITLLSSLMSDTLPREGISLN